MVEENTTTCACQGGWMCPNCADQHRAEISRLKAELEEGQQERDNIRSHIYGLRGVVDDLEHQLAEARAEVERLKEQFNRTSDVAYSFCQSAVKSTVVDICGMLKSAVQTSTPLECAKYIRDYYKLEG